MDRFRRGYAIQIQILASLNMDTDRNTGNKTEMTQIRIILVQAKATDLVEVVEVVGEMLRDLPNDETNDAMNEEILDEKK